MKPSTNPFFFSLHQEGSRNTGESKAIFLLAEAQNQQPEIPYSLSFHHHGELRGKDAELQDPKHKRYY
jgi:hypothetical protein